MKKFNELTEQCQSRCFNLSLTWQKMTNWSIEIYTGYKTSYKVEFFSDGHLNKKEAIKKGIKYMKELKKRGDVTRSPQF